MGGHLHIVKYLIQDKLCNPLCRMTVFETHLFILPHERATLKWSSTTSNPSDPHQILEDGRNMTPLERARSNGHTHVVNYLESLSTE